MIKSRVIMTVGAPGSGKTTYARSLDPTQWVSICLDDIRGALFGHKKVYFKHLDDNPWMRNAVHRVNRGMLRSMLTFEKNIILPNTHTAVESFQDVLKILAEHDIEPEIKVFKVPWEVLVQRERARTPLEAVGMSFLKASNDRQWSEDAWWRKMKNVEIIENGQAAEPSQGVDPDGVPGLYLEPKGSRPSRAGRSDRTSSGFRHSLGKGPRAA